MPRRPRAFGKGTLKSAPPMPRVVRRAVRNGRARAAALIRARKASRARAKGPRDSAGVLVAEGDSWFDYPLLSVLDALEDVHGYHVESVAHAGDRLESMAYDDAQLKALQRTLLHLRDQHRVPRALLLSGGGNDIAGDEFGMLLNHAASGLPALNEKIMDGVINQRLKAAISWTLAAATGFCREYFRRTIPIVVHGYAYPVPDGRGFLGGFWLLPGPWLQPGFRQKGYVTRSGDADLPGNTKILEPLINAFNAMVASLPGESGLEHVSYLDLRAELINEVAGKKYRKDWANELHPTGAAFKAVAKRFDERIRTFPKP
jgi:lysophospholipase L1-like esterase